MFHIKKGSQKYYTSCIYLSICFITKISPHDFPILPLFSNCSCFRSIMKSTWFRTTGWWWLDNELWTIGDKYSEVMCVFMAVIFMNWDMYRSELTCSLAEVVGSVCYVYHYNCLPSYINCPQLAKCQRNDGHVCVFLNVILPIPCNGGCKYSVNAV